MSSDKKNTVIDRAPISAVKRDNYVLSVHWSGFVMPVQNFGLKTLLLHRHVRYFFEYLFKFINDSATGI